jgi:hypothetical protein
MSPRPSQNEAQRKREARPIRQDERYQGFRTDYTDEAVAASTKRYIEQEKATAFPTRTPTHQR